MKNIYAVYIRELKGYFISPVFYIVATVFVLSVGNTFKDSFFGFATATMRQLRAMANYGGNVQLMNVNTVMANILTYVNFLFILIVPLLTMRLYAEEKKNGTMELLMTSPIKTSQVLLGKFFSSMTIYCSLLALTLFFAGILHVYSNGKLDWGPVISSYLGSVLLGGTLISIGMFFSSLTENQIIAAAMSLTFIMGLWLMIYSANLLSPPLSDFLRYLSIPEHLDTFTAGFIGIRHIVYYLSMTVFWLFTTGLTVESARWRQ